MSWLFAQMYDCLSRFDSAAIVAARRDLVGDLEGEILEVGVGNGLNLAHYPPGAHVTATDSSRHMIGKAGRRAQAAAARVTLQIADVQRLPFDDESFDHAVAGLVFCSVEDPVRGLRELGRVTRPGGTIRLLEHVRAEGVWLRRAQSGITPVWRRLADGCRLDRDTVVAARTAGLDLESAAVVRNGPRVAPMRLIRARARGPRA